MQKLTVKDFIYDTLETCNNHGIDLKLIRCDTEDFDAAYFSSHDMELVSAVNGGGWLKLLVHETCHLDQYIEGSVFWWNTYKDFALFDSTFLSYCSKKVVREAFQMAMATEVDCDLRALKKIKKYNLDIDVTQYIQESNLYHQSYYYFHKYKCFYDDEKSPLNESGLISMFNGKRILTADEKWCEHKQLGEFLKQYNKSI